jgi:lipoprotein
MKLIREIIKTAIAIVIGLILVACIFGGAVLQYSYSQRPLTVQEMTE